MATSNDTQEVFVRAVRREEEWSALMRAGLDGDGAAYRRLLQALAPRLRAMARRGLVRAGGGNGDAEDVVQEILLAIHLKRHTWRREEPFLPWLNAIARYKLIDVLRRRFRRAEIPIDARVEMLPQEDAAPELRPAELVKLVAALNGREHDVVKAVSLDGASMGEAAAQLSMSEGAVRVALHRGLKRLARLYRSEGEA